MDRKVIIFLFLIAFLGGCSSQITNQDAEGNLVICFGDSITSGVGAENFRNYPYYLGGLIGDNYELINAGVPGDTTRDALERMDDAILNEDPYLVIVEFGGNDFMQRFPIEETIDNLEKIITKIHEKNAMVALCDVSSRFILSKRSKDFKKLSSKTGCIFVPKILRDILEKPSLKADQIHPNSNGYKIIAEKIYKAVGPYLKKEGR